jgi:hypothetical protein
MDHVGRLPLVVVARELRVFGAWLPVAQAHLEAIETRNQTWQLVGAVYAAVVSVLAAVSVFATRVRARLVPLLGVVVAAALVAALTYGNQRFRLMAEPAIAVLASLTLVGRRARRAPASAADESTGAT